MTPPSFPQRQRARQLLRVREHWQPGSDRRWAVVRERGRGQSDEVIATYRTRGDAVAALSVLARRSL